MAEAKIHSSCIFVARGPASHCGLPSHEAGELHRPALYYEEASRHLLAGSWPRRITLLIYWP